MLPGDYSVDLQVNGKWVGRASVRFIAQPNSDIALPCIDRALIDRIGLDFEKLSASAQTELHKTLSDGCVDLKAMIPEATVTFDLSQLRLDITVPQAAMLRKPRGYVGPEFWDSGVPSATLGYNLNAYRSATSYVTTTDGSSGPDDGHQFRQLAPAPEVLPRRDLRAGRPPTRMSPPISLTISRRSAAT